MRKLSILVILALFSVGSASISDKFKETGEQIKERAHAAKDFVSGKFHDSKADVKQAVHGSQGSASINSASDKAQNAFGTLKDKAQAGKDFTSGKFHEIKADVKDSMNRASDKSEGAFDTLKDKAKAGKDFASAKFQDIKADAKDAFHSAKDTVKDAASKKKTQDANLRAGLSSITLVLLSLILGVLFFMSFGQSASVDKMKGKFFQARGNVKKAYHNVADKAKAEYYDVKAKSRSAARDEMSE